MKTLRSLVALCALALTALTPVHADPATLDQTYFFTNNETPVSELDAAYDIWGHKNDESYSFIVTYDFATGLDLAAVELSIWYYDTETDYEASDWVEGPGRDGGQGLSWQDGSIEIPAELSGTITVGVTFYFTDGTQLVEYLEHVLN